MVFLRSLCVMAGLTLSATAAFAEPIVLTIKDHKFHPETLEVPANTKIELLVKNEDDTAEEFESKSLSREKIIKGKSEGTVKIGPLAPGSYDFFGEFHMDTAKGTIVAK